MKALTLTSSLIAALSLTTFGQSDTSLRSQISLKEKELAEIQKELATLRDKLASAPATKYSVKTGDTISSIARRHGVSASDLMTWNKITDPTRLGIGQVLTIQGGKADVSNAPKAVRVSAPVSDYTIQSGDTFYSIARTHKLSVTELRALNPDVSTHLITTGQKLRVSGKPVAAVAKAAPKKPAPAPVKAPVVKKAEVKTAKVTPPPIKKSAPATIETKTSKKTEAAPTSTVKTKTPAPAPKKEEVVAVVKKDTPAPPTPPTPPVVEEEKTASKASVASIILTDETTFDAFAAKHGTNTTQLNALNGWNLPSATVLARGSEIYVPQ
ncbi:LysM peptidoglycan-binding domain-containing protein [Verrucomicrobiaceae bacterium 227]